MKIWKLKCELFGLKNRKMYPQYVGEKREYVEMDVKNHLMSVFTTHWFKTLKEMKGVQN